MYVKLNLIPNNEMNGKTKHYARIVLVVGITEIYVHHILNAMVGPTPARVRTFTYHKKKKLPKKSL